MSPTPPKFEESVVISGIGQSAVGRRLFRSPLSLTLDAVTSAVADAGLTLDDVSGLATYPGGGTALGPGFAGPPLSELYDALGLELDFFMGGYEGPAQLGPLFNAALAIHAGVATHVVVYRTVTEGTGRALASGNGVGPVADDAPSHWITPFGGGPPPLSVALLARRHFHEYGTTREQLAQIALTDRAHAQLNPHAVYRHPLTLEEYLSARVVAEPLSVNDCDVYCDGSTALVLSHKDYAPDAPRPPIRVEAMGVAPSFRADYVQHADLLPGGRAASQMWRRTDLTPGDVDVAAIYDGFSIIALLWLEALGFCGVGEGGAFVEGGKRIALGGDLPINTNGGQLSGGRLHGFGLMHEMCLQLRREAGDRQVDDPSVAAVSAGAFPYVGCMLLRAGDR